jgi:hypothetical protein
VEKINVRRNGHHQTMRLHEYRVIGVDFQELEILYVKKSMESLRRRGVQKSDPRLFELNAFRKSYKSNFVSSKHLI